MSRDLSEVITQITKVVPNDKTTFLYDLKNIKSSVDFAAPEMMIFWWRKTATVLHQHIEYPTEPWHHNIVKMWKGEA